MEMNNDDFRPDVHVAHKSRRDRLRFQQDHRLNPSSSSHHGLGSYISAHNLQQIHGGDDRDGGLNFSQVGNIWLANNQSHIFPCDHGLSGSSSSSLRIMNSNSTPMDDEALPNHTAFEILSATPSHSRSFGLEVEPFNNLMPGDDRAGPIPVDRILGPAYAADQPFLEDDMNYSHAKALCLTLSSVPSPKVHATHVADHEAPSAVNIIPSNVSQQVNPGPLGPFTGYSTILESSKFLRPTKQLLDEMCCIACPKNLEMSCDVSDLRIFDESSVTNVAELAGDAYGSFGGSRPLDSYCPENLRKKAKLICMQEEVSKRYEHYHQQMQMVVSSFESVSALSAATPYVCLALRTVAKHFRNLRNAIANKLKTLKNTPGEDHSASSSSSMMKFHEQSFRKPRSGGSVGVIENQCVWRPQRGLPEHAVSVLRAWLFDHFLHPYPTDTDKHMLAAQTGLTRNQVSNWFINARVRVWKPMVEEVHMLETEAMPGTRRNNNPDKSNEHSIPERDSHNPNRSLDRPNAISDATNLPPNADDNAWKSVEKRSRTESEHHHHLRRNQVANCDFDGSVLANTGGLGSVSLTLGLRQAAENGQRHLDMRPFFGGQL